VVARHAALNALRSMHVRTMQIAARRMIFSGLVMITTEYGGYSRQNPEKGLKIE
jgi:hypothetical protein